MSITVEVLAVCVKCVQRCFPPSLHIVLCYCRCMGSVSAHTTQREGIVRSVNPFTMICHGDRPTGERLMPVKVRLILRICNYFVFLCAIHAI